ncbi:MAG: hypothetical protein ACI8T1_001665 [Verrucomicrobiales bacterium]|jgi:hypothetical protein
MLSREISFAANRNLTLIEVATEEIITNTEAESALQDAVGVHGLRISVALYQRVLDEI